ncbi:MAG: tRNA glutamyl-Q(34) synthetase GluQRS [Gemmobacter sp.]
MTARVTRFAPSPTGPLHLGHAFSALTAWDRAAGGTFLLRIEDIDRPRCRPEWEAAIIDDLRWLGLTWPEPVMRQSGRMPAYRAALARLAGMGLVYPCRCSRADIRAAASAPQEGVKAAAYPGTCRGRPMAEAGPGDAIRLDIAAALARTGPARFVENGPLHPGRHDVDAALAQGDPVLARRDIGTSYTLAVVVDDAAQGVTEVVRGVDLFDATAAQALLQILLEYPRTSYWHHKLVRDDAGRRLAKRDDARSLAAYRAEGATPADIRRLAGL